MSNTLCRRKKTKAESRIPRAGDLFLWGETHTNMRRAYTLCPNPSTNLVS